MRHQIISILIIALAMTAGKAAAQSPALAKADADLAAFVAGYGGSGGSASQFASLLSSYRAYMYAVRQDKNNPTALNGLRKVYPYLIDGAIFFSQNNQPDKALEYALAYIGLPRIEAFRNERFARSDYYPTICYFAATTAYNNKQFADAIDCFRCYIQTGEQKNLENSYTYMARAYKFAGDLNGLLAAIDEALKVYPTTANFLYEAINACIEHKANDRLETYVNRALSLNPGDMKVLPVKAKLMADKGDYATALPLYERLYKAKPNDFNVCRMYATVAYNHAAQLINGANSIDNTTLYRQQRQKADTYLKVAAGLFERIVTVYPGEVKYLSALADTYKCMGRDADADRIAAQIRAQGGTYVASNVKSLGTPSGSQDRQTAMSSPSASPSAAGGAYRQGGGVMQQSAGAGGTMSLADVPAFSVYAKKYVEAAINKWQLKDDYETLDEYKARVTDATREAKIKELAAVAESNYIAEYGARVGWNNLRLERYDAENGVFLIKSPEMGDMLLPVPRTNNEARQFEAQWNTVKTDDAQFCISDDKLTLARLTFRTNTGKKYIYNNNASLTYQNTQIDYNFESVDMAALTAASAQKAPAGGGAKIVNSSVSVGKSDIDTGIPVSKKSNDNLFAVIISNENYRRESKVQFANNDGEAFRNYCIKTLGCPEKNVHHTADATFNDMKAEVNWMTTVANAYGGKARIIFYYAGHGIPDEATKSAYLLPVDGFGSDVSTGYSLDKLYATLGELPAEQVTVFLDACFSGSQRDGKNMASAARGVAIKAKNSTPKGNMVVMSAATGNETAYPYTEKGHGLFTYFLLKKLKDTKGDVSYGELIDYVHSEVSKKSIVENNKSQTPTSTAAPAVESGWRKWSFR